MAWAVKQVLDKMLELAKRNPIRTGILVVATTVLLVFATAETVRWVEWCSFAREAEAVTSTAPSGRTHIVALEFDAFGQSHRVRALVDEAQLDALRDFPAERAFQYRGRWRARFVSTLVDMQVRSDFLDEIATQLDIAARRLRLDEDEYLEFLVSAVQSIPYVAPDSGVRTPMEVVFEGEGICTEKSVLLAALMVHEGYDTVMWSFKSQRHVALGVATVGPSYRDTGYTFIETTSRAFIGQVDREYVSSGPIYGPPEQIELGGSKRYEAGWEVAFILRTLDQAEQRTTRSSAYPAYAQNAVSRRREFEGRAAEHFESAEVVDFIKENVGNRGAVYRALTSDSSVS